MATPRGEECRGGSGRAGADDGDIGVDGILLSDLGLLRFRRGFRAPFRTLRTRRRWGGVRGLARYSHLRRRLTVCAAG
jgi:hypothetical protein